MEPGKRPKEVSEYILLDLMSLHPMAEDASLTLDWVSEDLLSEHPERWLKVLTWFASKSAWYQKWYPLSLSEVASLLQLSLHDALEFGFEMEARGYVRVVDFAFVGAEYEFRVHFLPTLKLGNLLLTAQHKGEIHIHVD